MDELLNNIPNEMRPKLVDFKNKIDSIEEIIKKIEKNSIKDIHKELKPLEAAKFDWISLYTINALYFAHLKTKGAMKKDHALMNELNRTRNYMLRITDIQKKEEDKAKSHLVIDKESSARIIKRSLWQNAIKKAENKPTTTQAHQADQVGTITDDEPSLKRLKI